MSECTCRKPSAACLCFTPTDTLPHPLSCRGLISGVIVMLNLVLKAILQFLVEWEKHWTQSDKVGCGAHSRTTHTTVATPQQAL